MPKVGMILIVLMLASGCAQTTYWIKSGGSQEEFNITQASCHSQAYFIPRINTPQSSPNYQITTNISRYGQITSTVTPYKAPHQALADGLSTFADAMGNIATREAFVRDCLQANGWSQVSESELALTVDAYAIVGTDPKIEYTGKATGYLDGTGTINLINGENTQCVGTFKYNKSFTGGTGVVRCNDGDSAQIEFLSIDNSSGYGNGISMKGKKIKFVYGVPKDKRNHYLLDNK